jgi:hypothetical protein
VLQQQRSLVVVGIEFGLEASDDLHFVRMPSSLLVAVRLSSFAARSYFLVA